MDIKNKNLTFAEARRPWDEWGIREALSEANYKWRNCTPSDIDSVIELNGYFLFIEDKPQSDKFSPYILDGQMRMYQNLLNLSPKVSVWILIGDRDTPTLLHSVRTGAQVQLLDPTHLMVYIKEWAKWVNDQVAKEVRF